MKKLYLIACFLVAAVTCFSQSIVNRANSSYTVQDSRLAAQYNLLVPRYDDTTSALSQIGIDSCGAIIFTYSTNTLWVRSCADGKKWVEVGSGSSGSGTVTSIGITGSDFTITNSPITTSGNIGLTLATVNANVGTFGSATESPQFTVNAKGLITAVSNVTVTPAIGSITGLGTGVATALAVNVGSAGAIVVNGGALGTPSSGTLTNASGLPISSGVSGLGTGVATALAVNTGSAGSFILFNGALGTPTSGTISTGVTIGDVTMNVSGTDAEGDMYYRNSSGVLTRLPVGTAAQHLVGGTIPQWVDTSAGGGGSSLFPTTGTGTATGNVIGDLDGNTLEVQQGGQGLLVIDPSSLTSSLSADDGTGNTRITLQSDVTGGDVNFIIRTDDDNNIVQIAGDAVANTLEYSADTHTFTGDIVLNGSTSGTVTLKSDPLSNTLTGTTLSGEGYVGSTMFARLTSAHALADNNTAQAAFSSGLDVWTLQAATTYEFEGVYHLNMGTTNHTTSMGFTLGGGASVTSIFYTILSWNNAPGSAQTAQLTNYGNVATAVAASLFNASATITIRFKGMISMNAGGTVSPFVQFSAAPGGSNEVTAGSYIKFTPIGTNTTQSLGNVQ